jgi:tRNA G10  N-methylase Trm11
MEYMIRLAQCHETFRVPELQAVATLAGIDLEVVSYDPWVCRSFWNPLRSGLRIVRAQSHYWNRFVYFALASILSHSSSELANTNPPVTILHCETTK